MSGSTLKRRHAQSSQQQQQQYPQVYKDDMMYCLGIARRSVARAALHIGIDSMTAESIDTLASCLLEYMQRIGAMMANNAEASGRSSAYCNIYDAINAIELCTTAAASTTKLTNTLNGASQLDTFDTGMGKAMDSFGKVNFNNGTSWKDLASFCFGPNWSKSPSHSGSMLDPNNQDGSDAITTSRGGKAGPSTLFMMNGSSSTSNAMRRGGETGWNAPYPDEMQHFPVVLKKGEVANPHPFPEPRLHRRDVTVIDTSLAEISPVVMDTEEQDRESTDRKLPDSIFQNSAGWGGLTEANSTSKSDSNKRSLEQMNDHDTSKQPPAKRVKLMGSTVMASSTSSTTEENETFLFPTFYPRLPVPQNGDKRIIVTEGNRGKESKTLLSTIKQPPSFASAAEEDKNLEWDHNNPTRLQVRSALVGRIPNTTSKRLSSSSMYWGSSWSTTNRSIDLTVPPGRPPILGGTSAAGTEGSSAAAAASAAPSIVPISRASGSRVSRILEGSMEPPIL